MDWGGLNEDWRSNPALIIESLLNAGSWDFIQCFELDGQRHGDVSGVRSVASGHRLTVDTPARLSLVDNLDGI